MRPWIRRRTRRRLGAFALALAAGSVVYAARKPGSEVKPGFNLFSKQQDVQLGKEAAAEVRRQTHIVENRELQNYIAKIGRKLSSRPEADPQSFEYAFTLVTDKSINAFALPGGPAFVHTGLLDAAENEGQLAGVLGHEIAHVAMRHGTNQVSKANLLQIPAALASGVLGGGGGLVGQLAKLGIGLGANSILLKYSRDAESDADALGARIMSGAGYNPIEMARFFEKLEAEGGQRGPQFLSDHPNPGNRVKAVEEEIRFFPRRTYDPENSAEFTRMKALVAKLPAAPTSRAAGNAGRSGAGVIDPPSRTARTYRASTYQIAYPDNWQAFGGSAQDSVTIGPKQGIVSDQSGQAQVGYGAVLNYYTPSQRQDLAGSTNELIRNLRSTNPNMVIASQTQRRVRVGGSNALVTNLASASPFGGKETDVLVTVARPEGLFYMILVAPEREFAALNGVFDQMLQSIRFQ